MPTPLNGFPRLVRPASALCSVEDTRRVWGVAHRRRTCQGWLAHKQSQGPALVSASISPSLNTASSLTPLMRSGPAFLWGCVSDRGIYMFAACYHAWEKLKTRINLTIKGIHLSLHLVNKTQAVSNHEQFLIYR